MRKGSWQVAFLVAFLTAPCVASADTGTILMWATAFHLLVANVLIGIFEGVIVARLFRYPYNRAIAAFIPANYFSAFAGGALLLNLTSLLERLLPGQIPLYKAPPLLCLLGVLAWLFSVILEWPFCLWMVGKTEHRARKDFVASLVAQTASYALLVPYYLFASNINLYRNAVIERNLAFVKPPVATVYYINPQDGAVWRIRTNGEAKTKVLDAHIHNEFARLLARPNEKSGKWDLWMEHDIGGNGPQRLAYDLLRTDFASHSARSSDKDTGFNFMQGSDLRPETQREWKATTGFWAWDGITIQHSDKEWYNLGFDTPFQSWNCRNEIILPNNQVVFQLGEQIVLLDMPTRKLGLLTMGRGPVVTLDTP